jgi:CheY-like chemotaxis protein
MYPNKHLNTHTVGVSMMHRITNRHLKILIIDDDDEFRRAMHFFLSRKYSAQVMDVGSGVEAVEALKAGHPFDLVFLDLMMPGMSGIETYTELKKIWANCPVVLMSAHSDSQEWAEAEKLNVKLLSKPYPGHIITQILFDAASR